MPEFEFEFNQQDKELVISQDTGVFTTSDYMRLTIYPTEAINNIVDLPDDTKGIDGKAIFFSTRNNSQESYTVNISPFKDQTGELSLYPIGGISGEFNDFKIYRHAPTNTYYIKPNEIFNEFELPQGDYRIQIDFLNQEKPTLPFVIKQVSTSRKEVRLKIIDQPITNDSNVISDLTTALTTDGVYQFKHFLNIGTGDHIPIMNFTFDKFTDGQDNQSIILKLYDVLPTNIGNLSMVTIEREVLTTQLQDIFYFSDVPDVFFGDGLSPQPQEDWINPDGNDVEFQNYDELSGSLDDIVLDSLISESQYNYPNLNTDFSEFENHTFFGSAKKKLENFKTKVETIQGYYSEISSSLKISSSIEGDSSYIVQTRKNLFKKINDEIKTFTPYERFLYYDGQSETTASAPGLGKNYASSIPVSQRAQDNFEQLNGHDGFNVVYKHSDNNSSTSNFLFLKNYFAHDKPFFNYSGSIYLSFILKGTDDVVINTQNVQKYSSINGFGYPLPHDTKYRKNISKPAMSGSEYQRYVLQTSHSYFIPNTTNNDMMDLNFDDGDFNASSAKITMLHGNLKTGSYQIKDTTGFYPTTAISHSSFDTNGNVINGVPFFGSIMPAGELFRVNYSVANSAVTQSFITDVKLTLNDPSDVLPFDNIYHTSSTEWTNWYNGMIDSASAFDTDNIHSFENNLPLYIQESSEYNDMKDFLNLQGEQYDLIRNHIDSMGTIHKRGYKKTNSPPNNTLPMLLSNMGWQAINPFTGSLTDTLGSYLSSVTTIDDIKNNTWRKTLNNLLYIYKSKGTKNSVRALLNTYGYPPDVLEFQEFGGSTEESNPRVFLNTAPSGSGVDLSLSRQSGSFSFTTKKERLYRYIFNGKQDRVLNLDWYMDSADINSLEFIYKHVNTTQTQTILESSGSGNETLWDLRLVPSTDGISSSFEFRLSTANSGSNIGNDLGKSSISMSTSYEKITNGQLWNVMLQRMTSSVSGSGTNEYRLHAALQNGNTIETYNYVTMSVSGGLTNTYVTGGDVMTSSVHGLAYFANQNFVGSGSRHHLSSSNLFVGEVFSGSLAQIKGWSTALSTSKFRQHVLNKFSTVGNTIESYKDELVYSFKLNENYSSASVSASGQNLTIVDSAPTTTYSDYSIEKAGTFFTGSFIYGFDLIQVVKLPLQDNFSKPNNNTVLINPRRNIVGDLSPIQSAVIPLSVENSKPLFKTSPKLELYRSPQTFVDNFILDNLSGFNLETLYGNPLNYYSQSYNEFDTFRNDFFDAHPIEVDVNKFIRAHESMFNHSIIEGVKSIVPARSTFSDRNSNFGVEIRPTMLEKQKYENEEHSIEVNPNTATGSINPVVSSPTSERILPKSGSISVNANESGSYELPHTISLSPSPDTILNLILPKSGSISAQPTYNGSTVVTSSDGTIDYASIANESFIDIHKNWGTDADDTYFINYFDSGSDGKNNTYHIDTRTIFHTIGDHEYYSASKGNSSTFTDSSRFYSRLIINDDFHTNAIYDGKSYGTGSGIVNGRMMGKTRYFTTDSDGEIILPSNHITKFSYPLKERMIEGTQNTNPGILNVRYEDYSSASFYRVKVTGGENQIRVQTGTPSIDSNNKIIY